MSNLVNLVRTLLCLILVCLKPKIGFSGLITNRWTCSSTFDVWWNGVRPITRILLDPLILWIIVSCRFQNVWFGLLKKWFFYKNMVYYSKVLLCTQDNLLALVLHCFVTAPLQNDYCFLPRREYCFCACLSLVKTSKNNLQNM